MIIQGDEGANRLRGTAGADTLLGMGGDDVLFGRGGHDVLAGGGGDDQLIGGRGHDYLIGGDGDDLIDGGAGIDWADYEHARAGVRIDLSRSAAQDTAGAGIDQLVSIERLYGSAFADTLRGDRGVNLLKGQLGADRLAGDRGADYLDGGDGEDRLFGGRGEDLLIGGLGPDRLAGGAGDDSFIFASLDEVRGDVIADYASGDWIDLSAIDADCTRDGDQFFRLTGSFTGSAGQARLTWHADTDTTTIDLDVDGDMAPDASMTVNGGEHGGIAFVL